MTEEKEAREIYTKPSLVKLDTLDGMKVKCTA